MSLRQWMVVGLPLLVAAVGLVPAEARAASASCDDKTGSCDISNDGMDSISCLCADGGFVGGGGGSDWAGLDSDELEAVCFEQLAAFCGEPPPPTGVPCETDLGACTVDNEPDQVFCECADGSEPGGFGGSEWDGLDDDALYDVCLEQVEYWCTPSETTGEETSTSTTDPTIGPTDTTDPTDPTDSTTDPTGSTTDPTATGTTGDTDPGTTGDTDPGTTGDTDPGTTGDTDPGTTGATMTGNDDDSMTGATMTGQVSATAGEEESSSEGTAGADGGGDGSGCSCDVDGRDRSGLLGLGLLGLLGLRSRRRR